MTMVDTARPVTVTKVVDGDLESTTNEVREVKTSSQGDYITHRRFGRVYLNEDGNAVLDIYHKIDGNGWRHWYREDPVRGKIRVTGP